MKQNQLNADVPASVVKEATDALELAFSKLKPYLLINITKSQLEGYNRMGENGKSFVNIIYDCIHQDENLIPRAYSIEEALADKNFYTNMKELSTRIEHISGIININCELAGIEVLDLANEVYFAIKRRNLEGDPACMAMFETIKSLSALPVARS